MKKHIITFLIVSAFTSASAQSYTQVFDTIFQHVGFSHTSTGILYERARPVKRLTQLDFRKLNTDKEKSDTSGLFNYQYSIGVCVGAWFNGISLKSNLAHNLYLQSDFGLGIDIRKSIVPEGCDIGFKINLLYENRILNRTNTYWLVGGGIVGGIVPHDAGKKEVSLKGGVQAILGIEYIFDSIPMSLQIDTREGYGIIYSAKGTNPSNRIGMISNNNPYHFFDYSFVFSLRFHFNKKN